MKAVHGNIYDFHPQGFLLPSEYTKFIGAWTKAHEEAQSQETEKTTRGGNTTNQQNQQNPQKKNNQNQQNQQKITQ